MSASVDIPDKYTITLGGGLELDPVEISGDPSRPLTTLVKGDKDAPVTTLMTGDSEKPLATLLTGDPGKPISTLLTGDPNKPMAATIEMLNIPRLSLDDIKDLLTPKLRIQMPNYQQLCFKLFGMEVFSLCLSGESQVITQPFRPNKYERCEPDCPDLDVRPFPEDTGTHRTVSV